MIPGVCTPGLLARPLQCRHGSLDSWDPHVVLDLHATNGSYHGYHLTYAPSLNPNADTPLVGFARETLLPGVRRVLLDKHQYRSYSYGNFVSERGSARETPRVDPESPGDKVWRTFDHRPRFGNNYLGLRNRIAVLSEAYSYLDFKGRIDVTAAFVEEIFNAAAANAQRILQLTAQADRVFAAPPSSPVTELGVDSEVRALPTLVDILVGDVTKQPNPRSGKERLQMRSSRSSSRTRSRCGTTPRRRGSATGTSRKLPALTGRISSCSGSRMSGPKPTRWTPRSVAVSGRRRQT